MNKFQLSANILRTYQFDINELKKDFPELNNPDFIKSFNIKDNSDLLNYILNHTKNGGQYIFNKNSKYIISEEIEKFGDIIEFE